MISAARAETRSLADVHSTVGTSQVSFWRRMFAFAGPAYLVSVGYMDPGNWATDLEGGARFGYTLLWVLVASNLMAILLQTLSARLGIVTGRDLAQACRESYPRPVTLALWVLCEIAIAACDLAEVLGAAIALNLLFHIPLLMGVLLTACDTLLLLWFQGLGIRYIEAFILALITVMGACFCVEIVFARPNVPSLIAGVIPRINNQSLYVAIGMLGATVMPHNLYLHSALVQTRQIGHTAASKRAACRYNLVDSVVALNAALLVNAAILILSAAVFFRHGIVVTEIQQAHLLLVPLLGTAAAGILFAIALLCSGQSSTLTGTLAGQIVMEGFLNVRMRPWLRRLITRTLAIIPAAITIYIMGDKGTYQLLILSQVILSMQLPFAVIPLIHFTSDRQRMGDFANKLWVQVLSWAAAILILALNIWLLADGVEQLLGSSAGRPIIWIPLALVGAAIAALLVWISFEPLIAQWARHRFGTTSLTIPEPAAEEPAVLAYRRILVPLDHTDLDRQAVGHAAAMAKLYGATLYLLHVEEGVTSRVYGPLSSTAEVEAGEHYLERIAETLRAEGIPVETAIVHAPWPGRQIVRYAAELKPDLVVMGAHGHRRLKDLIFGNTITPVRHQLRVPLLIVRKS
ncbi:MAG TPA: Nramp family divalent metal transporter [Bryobacteraceae bacterium]|nr:Nramp family divalent metal transporter [Bryobacteraceae bacterium]